MRGFLRNTAPYVNLPLQDLFTSLTSEGKEKGGKNCFVYMLLYLICQLEDGAVQGAEDLEPSAADRDPRLRLDLASGEVEVSDEGRRTFTARLRLER